MSELPSLTEALREAKNLIEGNPLHLTRHLQVLVQQVEARTNALTEIAERGCETNAMMGGGPCEGRGWTKDCPSCVARAALTERASDV